MVQNEPFLGFLIYARPGLTVWRYRVSRQTLPSIRSSYVNPRSKRRQQIPGQQAAGRQLGRRRAMPIYPATGRIEAVQALGQ